MDRLKREHRRAQLGAALVLALVQGLCLGTAPSPASAAEARDPRQRPNVLLIVADDASFGDVPWGGGNAAMPNLQSLAAEGVAFGNF
ncbi:MAG: hypothetical protein AB1Z22_00355, partial [Synechococcaceae cyanobacterium]